MPTESISAVSAPTNPEREAEVLLRDRMVLGDARAWKTFQERYGRLIASAIVRVVGRFGFARDSEDVREIEATLALDLLANGSAKLRAFDPSRGARLGTWIAMLASHAAYDFLRKKRREPRPDHDATEEELVSNMPDPHGLCELGERARVLARVTRDFSAKDREFLELYFAEGLDPAEVATRMGISIKTVYSKKHKIVGRLEQLLEKKHAAA